MKAVFAFIIDCIRILGRFVVSVFKFIESSSEAIEQSAERMNESNKEWANKKMEQIKATELEKGSEAQNISNQNNLNYGKLEILRPLGFSNEELTLLKIDLSAAELNMFDFKPKFYNSETWKQLRQKSLSRYGAFCMRCQKSTEDGVPIQVTHIKRLSKYPELALIEDNLQILCKTCSHSRALEDEADYRSIFVET